MKTFAIDRDLDAYLAWVTAHPRFLTQENISADSPLTREAVVAQVADALRGSAARRGALSNYRRLRKLMRALQTLLDLPFAPCFFVSLHPADAYYVHRKNRYFSRQGIYISIRTLGNFEMAVRLLMHELCHYCVSVSPHGRDIFRITHELEARLGGRGPIPEQSALFALNPTEYFALLLEAALLRQLCRASCPCDAWEKALALEEARLAHAVAVYQRKNTPHPAADRT